MFVFGSPLSPSPPRPPVNQAKLHLSKDDTGERVPCICGDILPLGKNRFGRRARERFLLLLCAPVKIQWTGWVLYFFIRAIQSSGLVGGVGGSLPKMRLGPSQAISWVSWVLLFLAATTASIDEKYFPLWRASEEVKSSCATQEEESCGRKKGKEREKEKWI